MTYRDLSGLATESPFDVEDLRTRLRHMSDAELLSFAKQMHSLSFPLTYDFRGEPTVSAFSIQLEEARAEW